MTIDLDNVSGITGQYDYDTTFSIITVTAAQAGVNDTVRITGDGRNGYSIKIEAAKNITIDDNTTIKGAYDAGPGLTVPDDTTITGLGSGITITGGIGDDSSGVTAINSNGALTILGTIGSVTGGGGHQGNGGVGDNNRPNGKAIKANDYSVLDYTNTTEGKR